MFPLKGKTQPLQVTVTKKKGEFSFGVKNKTRNKNEHFKKILVRMDVGACGGGG